MASNDPNSSASNSENYPLIALACTTIALFGTFAYTSLRVNLLAPVWIYFYLYLTAYAVYVYAASRVVPIVAEKYGWITPFLIITGAVFRLMLVHTPPSLSTDIYRYVWDGRLTIHGINPFRWSPLDPRLAHIRDATIWVPMEYKPYQTVYMSVSQAIFALTNLVFGNSLTGFKIVYTFFDIGNIILLTKLLKRLGQPSWKVVWYAWCPLPIIEIGLSGHQDVTGVFFFLATFLLFASERIRLSSITLAASVLTKGFPLLLIPLFARRAGWRYGVLAVVSLIVLGVPQILEAREFLHGMQQYLMSVQVNGSVHALIDHILQSYTTKHIQVANEITDLIMLTFVAVMVARPVPSLQELMRRSLIIVCSCLLVVPTLFPWYLVWLIPIAACVGKRPSVAVIVLVGTVVMNYSFYIAHETYWWSAWVEYTPFYLVLLWEWSTGYWRPVDSVVESDSSEMEESSLPVVFDLDARLDVVDA